MTKSARQTKSKAQIEREITAFLDEEGEPLTERDLQDTAKFDQGRFGLTRDEAMTLVSRSSADYKALLGKIEQWREQHGFPAQSSQLTRGYIRGLIGLGRPRR